uniref:Uncharacterized protein n=1 Tax=Babesia bovis TaxID=5865 RepID=S6C8N9_BABBO|nr:hypothetical protein [Babesia bovis]
MWFSRLGNPHCLGIALRGAGCVFRARGVAQVVQTPARIARGSCTLHTVSSICSRLATLEPAFRVPKRSNVQLVRDHSEFHSIVYSIPEHERVKLEDLVISVFVTEQNTSSMSIFDCIDQLSMEYPGNRFLIIDADQVPRAAYDADLQQFPAVLLSFGGDIYRRLLQVSGGYPSDWEGSPRWDLMGSGLQPSVECTLPGNLYAQVKDEVTLFSTKLVDKDIASIKSRCGTHSYTHGIDTDNLNVKRVGWPTE